MTTDELTVDAELDRRLRRTLHAVADTVTEAPDAAVLPPAPPARRNRRRRALVAAGCGLAAVPLAAFAYGRLSSEYVQALPPPGVVQSGEMDGIRYWLVESFHEDACGRQMAGVELLSEARNRVGQEWSSSGMAYGDQVDDAPGCPTIDEAAWLADPARAAVSWTRLGGDPTSSEESGPWGAMIAVHPTVRSVTVEAAGLPEQRVPTAPLPDDPTGPRYAAVVVPEDAGVVTVSLVHDGERVTIEDRDLSRLGDLPD